VLFSELVATSAAVAETSGRLKKIELLATCLRQMTPDERAIGARYLAGEVPQKTQVGYAQLVEARTVPPSASPYLGLSEIDRRLTELAELHGAGSAQARKDQLGALFSLATAPEQVLLAGLIVGEVRQGALDGLVLEAIAKAGELPIDIVRRAYMLSSDLGEVAAVALEGGAAELGRYGLTLFRPILPMLAQTADDAAGALELLDGEASFEVKLDGFRVQIHKDGEDVRAFSRGLNDVSHFAPEIIAAVRAMPARRLVLDGEAIVYGPNQAPLPFQDTMKRFGKKGLELRATAPLSLALFDILMVDDQILLTSPAQQRFAALAEYGGTHAARRLITRDAAAATAFYDAAIAKGHEGVMAKALDAPYDAGSRGAGWLKIKRVHHLDLVVLAAEWGSGRRKGWLSNIHLGARDDDDWVMLGKTFKGMTDEMLRWQTAAFLAREVDRDGHIVYVKPEIVAEIAFNDVQRSPRYPGGLALRLARVVRYREDKTAAEANTIGDVRAIAAAAGVI